MPCPYYTGEYCNVYGYLVSVASEYDRKAYCLSASNWQYCANYKGSGRGYCFLTTACVHYAGLSDDCEELTGMRNFRDGYLLSLPNGQEMFDEYYRLAPAIVEAIEQSEERSQYLADILARVRQCVHFADSGNNEAALDVYTTMFNELKNRFVSLSS